MILDSINDRDLDSSVAQKIAAPLAKVPEVEEQKETTTFEKDETPKDGLVQLNTQLQRSRTAEKGTMLGVEPSDPQYKTQPAEEQKEDVISNSTHKSNATAGGSTRKKMKISIDTNQLDKKGKRMSDVSEQFQKSL